MYELHFTDTKTNKYSLHIFVLNLQTDIKKKDGEIKMAYENWQHVNFIHIRHYDTQQLVLILLLNALKTHKRFSTFRCLLSLYGVFFLVSNWKKNERKQKPPTNGSIGSRVNIVSKHYILILIIYALIYYAASHNTYYYMAIFH